MYPPMEMDNGTYYPKPMNCPMHCLIFRSRQRSYRELPLRLFELGTVYRYERSGTLHGLMRVRGFTQDDAHIFCTRGAGCRTRSRRLLDFVLSVLRAFGFDEFDGQPVDPGPEQVVGDDADLGAGHEALRGRARGRAGCRTRSRRATPRSTARRSTSTSATPSAARWQLSHHPGRLQPARALRPRVRRRRQRASPAGHDPPGPVRLDRALLRRAHRALRRRLPDVAGARCRCGCCRSATTTRPTPRRWSDRLRAEGFRVDVVEATDRSASASAPPSSRSCPTCWSSATTTSPRAPSASTRAAARSSVGSRSTTSSAGVARRDRRGHRRRRLEPDPCWSGSGRVGGRRTSSMRPTRAPNGPCRGPTPTDRFGVHAHAPVGAAGRRDPHRAPGRTCFARLQRVPVHDRAPADRCRTPRSPTWRA